MNHRDTETPRDSLTQAVIGAAIEVHRELGPGLLESAYEECLAIELSRSGIAFARQVALPVIYKGMPLDLVYRVAMIVESQLVLELKAVEILLPVHQAQLLTYLRLAGIRTGLLLNFNAAILRDGLRRMVL